MLFFVGMSLVQKDISFKGSADKARPLLLLITIVGSYLGTLLTRWLPLHHQRRAWYGKRLWLVLPQVSSSVTWGILFWVLYPLVNLCGKLRLFYHPAVSRLGRRYFYPAVCTWGHKHGRDTGLATSHFGTKSSQHLPWSGDGLVSPLLILSSKT